MPKPTHPNIAEWEQKMDALPVVERCLFCEWSWSGMAVDGRQEAVRHRLRAHPDVLPTKRKRGAHLKSFRQPNLKAEDWKDIYAERAKRARLTGVVLEDSAA